MNDQLPPHCKESEELLLGSILRYPDCFDDVLALVPNKDFFYFDSAQKIFQAMLEIQKQNKPMIISAIAERLNEKMQVEDIGGYAFLANIWKHEPTGANWYYHSKAVREKYRQRTIINLLTQTLQDAHKNRPPDDLISDLEKRLASLGTHSSKQPRRIDAIAEEYLEDLQKRRESKEIGIPTGLTDLDEYIVGLHNSELTTLAGRPGGGKTALALQLWKRSSAENKTALFFSLEQSEKELIGRILASEADVNPQLIRKANLTQEQMERLYRAQGSIKGLPLWIADDQSSSNMRSIISTCRKWKSRENLGMVVIDYAQLVDAQEGSNRQEEVAAISRQSKRLARELDVPILLLAQLNRLVEQRSDGRPRLSDLRESGGLEQDSDNVLLLYKPSESHKDPSTEPVNIIVAKQRNGPVGEVFLIFRKTRGRFENRAKEDRGNVEIPT